MNFHYCLVQIHKRFVISRKLFALETHKQLRWSKYHFLESVFVRVSSLLEEFFQQSKSDIFPQWRLKQTVSTIKLMNQDLVRLDHFDGSNFTCWQDKLCFLLTSLNIINILDPDLPPLPEPIDEDTEKVKATRKQREYDELICREHILNVLSDRLYDLYTKTKSAKEIWTALEFKYKAKEKGTNKFLISMYFDFCNFFLI